MLLHDWGIVIQITWFFIHSHFSAWKSR